MPVVQPSSISFDDVLGLLRGPLVQQFEAHYAASRGYTVTPNWGDSQALAKVLAFASITRAQIEDILISRADLLGRFQDALLALPDDGEEWPEGEEPEEEPSKVVEDQPVVLGRGFSIMAAGSVSTLEQKSEPELVSWLKFRRIPHHKNFARDLREIFKRCVA